MRTVTSPSGTTKVCLNPLVHVAKDFDRSQFDCDTLERLIKDHFQLDPRRLEFTMLNGGWRMIVIWGVRGVDYRQLAIELRDEAHNAEAIIHKIEEALAFLI